MKIRKPMVINSQLPKTGRQRGMRRVVITGGDADKSKHFCFDSLAQAFLKMVLAALAKKDRQWDQVFLSYTIHSIVAFGGGMDGRYIYINI